MRASELPARLPQAAAAVTGQHGDPRRGFPRRPEESSWPASLLSAQEILARIDMPPFQPANGDGYRRHGTARMLEWLAGFPAGSWQQRWKAAGAEGLPKEEWLDLPMQWRQANGWPATPYHRDSFQTGLLMLVCADVIRPGLSWMVPKASGRIVPVMTACRDPEGYAALQDLIDADPGGITAGQARLALSRITMILACKGGMIGDITVGDYLDLLDAMRETRTGGAGRLLAYRLLHALGHLGPDAPATGRAFLQAAGQRAVGELVDRYQLQCRPVRHLLVDKHVEGGAQFEDVAQDRTYRYGLRYALDVRPIIGCDWARWGAGSCPAMDLRLRRAYRPRRPPPGVRLVPGQPDHCRAHPLAGPPCLPKGTQ